MQIADANKTLLVRFGTLLLITSFLTLGACGSNSNAADLPSLPDDTVQEQPVGDDQAAAQIPQDASANLNAGQREGILQKYSYVDPTRVVPTKALADALVYFEANKNGFRNQDYISVIDFSKNSSEPRFYIVSMKTGEVWSIRVAHGKGSDANHDGFAEKFSNTSGAHASSLGYYRTAETYYGAHGLSLRLDGLSSTNSKARSRAVVIHGANYVQDTNVKQGRSWGCPAVSMENIQAVIKYLKGGSLIYAVN
ncbi:murein L,D-transpeptidase catalytic domain family protein [Bdellovibrio sp. 22V]|uniref:murein L,D-transpeptidase catalytic domain family protein n=1 Tax=Bdellovibrio TaxID=958 RepID=UPI0025430DE4|nr:murein L,D-transpeptidase catalytic domain family protein [Bdellovibrio sp. 22V]WII73831.1 murein L,D-transpeptidase catalytic domain family protein [Bdellovibrio sp. 22V]